MYLLKSLLFVIIFSCPVYSTFNEPTDCRIWDIPFCLNKSHILCEPRYQTRFKKNPDIQSAILTPLNNFRANLRRYQFICNLPDLVWNPKLASLSRAISCDNISQKRLCCNITREFKNMLHFSEKFPNNKPDKHMIEKVFIDLTNQISPNAKEKNLSSSWIFSAYSTDIGCALDTNTGRLHCMVNGIILKYYRESFGFHNKCNMTESVIGNKICAGDKSTCTNHYICDRNDWPSGNPLSMSFTATRFILTKFEKRKGVVWDIDLQYFAERIITQTLTDNDKCLAQEHYPEISAIHFSGVQYFSDDISNIDSVWMRRDVDNRIGCVSFNTSTINKTTLFNLYCLTGNGAVLDRSFTQTFLRRLDFNESDCWLIYALLFLTYLDVIAVLVVCRLLKMFERKRLIYSFND